MDRLSQSPRHGTTQLDQIIHEDVWSKLRECGKMRNRKTPNTDTFYAVVATNIRQLISDSMNLWNIELTAADQNL